MKARVRPSGVEAPPTVEIPLNPQRGTPGEQRLAVYAGGYIARIREALAELFEAVHHVLGEDVFTELAEGYAARYPSHDYNLSLAGRHLPEFLVDWPRSRELPFLPDLARLEWLICRAFHAFDQPPIDPVQMAAMPPKAWERARLIFQPSVGLIASVWPILDIWQARTQPRERINLTLADRPQRVLVSRRDVQVVCEPLDPAQYQLLDGLRQGRTLGEVCADLATTSNDTLPLTDWFARWTRAGLIVRCEVT